MPRGMTDTEKKRWRDRSAQADHVWKEKGLVGEQPSGGDLHRTMPNIVRTLDAYRGDQWGRGGMPFLNGILPESHLVINSMFSSANTMEAQHLARMPRARVFPRTSAAAAAATPFEKALNWGLRETRTDREWKRSMRDAFFRFGITRLGYTPPDETHDAQGRVANPSPSRADLPWLRRVAPWDIRIDPLAETWHADGGAEWCEFISLHTIDQLKRMPNVTVPRDLEPTVSRERRDLMDRRARERGRGMGDSAMLVEVRTVYDRVERKWFQWSPGSEGLLRQPDDWPAVLRFLEGLPYSMLAYNETTDDACPVGYADMVWPLQAERNKVRTMLSELVRRHRRMVFANEAAFEGSSKDKIEQGEIAEVYYVGGDVREAVADFGVAGFDQGLLLYDGAILEDIRETIGQSKLARAQRINVESATEAAEVGAGDDLQVGRNQVAVEDWLRDSIRLFAGAMQALPDTEWVFPVLGERDALALLRNQPEVMALRSEAIAGEFLFEIEAGSTQPRNDQQEVAKSLQWLQVAQQFPGNVNIPVALLELAQALDKNPGLALLNSEQAAQLQRSAQAAEEPIQGEGGNVNPAPFLEAAQRGNGSAGGGGLQ